MLVIISNCFADGETGDSVNQGKQPYTKTGALTPGENNEYQVDMCLPPFSVLCLPPFSVWFGGTPRVCLLLACACCIYVQHSGQPTYFSMQACVQSIHHVFCHAWVYVAKCEVTQVESIKQDDCCFGGKTICESYSTLARTVYLLSCSGQTLSGQLSLLLLLVLLYAGASSLV